jgi:hypothetical protein
MLLKRVKKKEKWKKTNREDVRKKGVVRYGLIV